MSSIEELLLIKFNIVKRVSERGIQRVYPIDKFDRRSIKFDKKGGSLLGLALRGCVKV